MSTESTEAMKASGFSGSFERWTVLRKPVADCVDRAGSFLDVGCANGLLLECVVRWASERGLGVDPYGVDLSEPLLLGARFRFPELADHFWSGDAGRWLPPRKFDFVRTELVYAPAEREGAYVRHLLANCVAPGGALLVANYLEGAADAAERVSPGANPTTDICARLIELGFRPDDVQDGLDPVKGRRTRVAVIRSTP